MGTHQYVRYPGCKPKMLKNCELYSVKQIVKSDLRSKIRAVGILYDLPVTNDDI